MLNVDNFESELVEAVDTILADGLDTYRDNAFEGVQNKSWSSLCDQLLGYYRQAIAQGGKAAPRKGSQRDFTGVREVPRPVVKEAPVEAPATPAPQVSAEPAAKVGTEPAAK